MARWTIKNAKRKNRLKEEEKNIEFLDGHWMEHGRNESYNSCAAFRLYIGIDSVKYDIIGHFQRKTKSVEKSKRAHCDKVNIRWKMVIYMSRWVVVENAFFHRISHTEGECHALESDGVTDSINKSIRLLRHQWSGPAHKSQRSTSLCHCCVMVTLASVRSRNSSVEIERNCCRLSTLEWARHFVSIALISRLD